MSSEDVLGVIPEVEDRYDAFITDALDLCIRDLALFRQ